MIKAIRDLIKKLTKIQKQLDGLGAAVFNLSVAFDELKEEFENGNNNDTARNN